MSEILIPPKKKKNNNNNKKTGELHSVPQFTHEYFLHHSFFISSQVYVRHILVIKKPVTITPVTSADQWKDQL